MRNFLLPILFFSQASCFASTFTPDTVDNWQIYNGSTLILAGTTILPGPEIAVVLKKDRVDDLRIKYNHCAKESLHVTIELLTRDNKVLLIRNFDPAANDNIHIPKSDLKKILDENPYLRIRYKEKKPNGVDTILGAISIQ